MLIAYKHSAFDRKQFYRDETRAFWMSDLNDTAYWLERAHQARSIAESLADGGAYKQMISVADGYDQMAKMAQQLRLHLQRGDRFEALSPLKRKARGG